MLKRILSLALALSMLLSTAVFSVAYADEPATETEKETVTATELPEAATETSITEYRAPEPSVAGQGGPFGELTYLPYDGCTTTILDIDGQMHRYIGCLDASSLESHRCCKDMAAYMVYLDDQLIIKVALHDVRQAVFSRRDQDAGKAANGYYSVSFDLDAEQQAYLTGLTPENLDTVQSAILSAKLNGQDASFEDMDFIDTEKCGEHQGLDGLAATDYELCWAAAASNILHYTGWGREAGFGSTDYIFDVFNNSFSDLPGNTRYGLGWFFNGYFLPQGWDNWASVVDGTYGTFKGYFPGIPVETVMDSIDTNNKQENLRKVTDALESDHGVQLSLSLYDNETGTRWGGHAITLWGYVRSKTDADDYRYLIVSDSDSHKGGNKSRRAAPNTVQALAVSTCTLWNKRSWMFSDYGTAAEGVTAVIDDFTVLKPYSDQIPMETEGTGDRFACPDLTITGIGVDNRANRYGSIQTVFPQGQELFVASALLNASTREAPKFRYSVSLTKDGEAYGSAIDRECSYDALYGGWRTTGDDAPVSLGVLPAGDYCVTVVVNPRHDVEEANYSNNTRHVTFRVEEGADPGALQVTLGDMGIRENGEDIGADAQMVCPAAGDYYYVYTAYGDDAPETDWTSAYEGSVFPETLFTRRDVNYNNVYYRVLVKKNGTQALSEYLSGAVAQRYRYIHPDAEEGNTYELTARTQGTADYAPNEETRFNFTNWSTVDDAFSFDWRLRAYQEDLDGASYRLGSEYGTDSLPPAYCFADPVTNNRLCTNTDLCPPPGRYDLYAEAEFEDLLGKTEIARTWVGSVVITAAGEMPRVAAYDAMYVKSFGAYFGIEALAALDEPIRLGVEYGRASDFSDARIAWLTDGYTDYERMNIREGRWIEDLFPDTAYWYRAVLEEKSGHTVRGEAKTLSTTGDRTEGLSLGSTATVSLDSKWGTGDCDYNYLFRPDASGWYHISIRGGDCVLYSFSEDGDRETTYAKAMLVETDLYLREGVRYCLRIVSNVKTKYWVTVTNSTMTVDRYTVALPPVKPWGSYAYRLQPVALMPRGRSFCLGIQYGPDPEDLTEISTAYENWSQEKAAADLVMSCLPGRTYYYRAFVRDTDTGETAYTDFRTVAVAVYEGHAMPAGTHTLRLDRDQSVYLRSVSVDRPGAYTIRVDGPDGVLGYWDGAWIVAQFSLNGKSTAGALAAGECAYCKVTGYSPGEYHVTYTFTPTEQTGTMTVSCPGFVPKTGSAADPGTMEIIRRGDVNGTSLSEITFGNDVTDMQGLYEYLSAGQKSGAIQDDGYFAQVADVNADGAVNILDYQALYLLVKAANAAA